MPIGQSALCRASFRDAREHLIAPTLRRKLADASGAPKLIAPGEQPCAFKSLNRLKGRRRHIGGWENFN
jgi:hypothetical protein